MLLENKNIPYSVPERTLAGPGSFGPSTAMKRAAGSIAAERQSLGLPSRDGRAANYPRARGQP